MQVGFLKPENKKTSSKKQLYKGAQTDINAHKKVLKESVVSESLMCRRSQKSVSIGVAVLFGPLLMVYWDCWRSHRQRTECVLFEANCLIDSIWDAI